MTPPFEDLKHRDHRVRRAALARAADRLADDPAALAALLLPMLGDRFPGARADAALILGDAASAPGGGAALEGLVARAADPDPDTAQAALLGLGRAGLVAGEGLEGPQWASPRRAALEAVGSEDADVRFQALTALARLCADGPEVVEAAREALDDEDAEIVGVAAELLAALGDGEAAEILWRRVDGLPRGARLSALLALAHLRSSLEARPSNPGQLPSPERAEERGRLVALLLVEARKLPWGLRACDALGLLGAAEAVEPLASLASSFWTHRLIKVAAAEALVRLGDPRGAELLARFLGARRRDMRGLAIERVGALGLGAHRGALIAILRDPRDYHADTAALALGLLGDEEALDALEGALGDLRAEVRAEAAGALAACGRAGERLKRLMNDDPDEGVRRAASGQGARLGRAAPEERL